MELETDLLADLIAQKHRCLVALREMGFRQRELIRQGEINRLLDLLSGRQHAMAELQRIERKLDPFRRQDPEARSWRSADDRRRCAELAAECETLLSEIIGQEKQSESELVQKRDEVANRLQGVHAASQARGAYTAAPRPEGTRLDIVSDTQELPR